MLILHSRAGDICKPPEDLGRAAFELIEKNEISHPGLAAQADEVRKFRAQLPPEPTASAGPEPTAPAGQA